MAIFNFCCDCENLTVLGPRLFRFIGSMVKAESVILSTSDALEKLNDSVKSEIGTIIRLTQRLKDVNISIRRRKAGDYYRT